MTVQEWTARRALVLYMSDLSERYWCAGWFCDWENYCREGVSTRSAEQGTSEPFAASELHTLRVLNEAAGGWWPADYEEAAPYDENPLPPEARP